LADQPLGIDGLRGGALSNAFRRLILLRSSFLWSRSFISSHCPSPVFSLVLEISVGSAQTPDTRIFSHLAVARLCVTIGRYWYLSKRLTAVGRPSSYRFEHIETDSSFKAHSKQASCFEARLLFLRQWKVYVLPRFRHKTSTAEDSRELKKRGRVRHGVCFHLL
jgi:hypothetical protein